MTNRLRSSLLSAHASPTHKKAARTDAVTAAQFSSDGERHTALFAPLHYERNYAYPLLVWLHGARDDESQLKRIMPLISMRNYVAAAPRAPRVAGAVGWPLGGDQGAAEQLVFDAIDAAQARFNVSARRVFIAGFDDGGSMAFRLAMDYPRRFAGVLSLCGRFPAGQSALRQIALARQVPIFLACGRDSRRYATLEVCEHLKLFHAAGMNVSLRQYPCGQEMVPAMLGDMDRWIMEQISASSASRAEEECVEDLDLR